MKLFKEDWGRGGTSIKEKRKDKKEIKGKTCSTRKQQHQSKQNNKSKQKSEDRKITEREIQRNTE